MQKSTFITLLISLLLFSGCNRPQYKTNEGRIFGTTYRIVYEHLVDQQDTIKHLLVNFNKSLSTYDSTSIISRVNRDEEGVVADLYFTNLINTARDITTQTNGAFDMTVGPLVNAWGFGYKKMVSVTDEIIDSLLQYVGMHYVTIENGIIIKHKPGVMLDGSAIAKGYGVDVVAAHLKSLGIKNYLVEIGGEVVTSGINARGHAWRIGIDRPIDDVTVQTRELQMIIGLSGKALATSGNYRNFYIKEDTKYAHTIDPRTGYPVQHSLLSATIIANDCMTADAYATACMVLGVEESIALIEQLSGIEGCFIFQNGHKEDIIWTSGFEQYIVN